MLFILEHNTSIMGSMESIAGTTFGKFPKEFWANLWAYLTEAYNAGPVTHDAY